MATEVMTDVANPGAPAAPDSQLRIQFTTNLAGFQLPESTGPILVPTRN